MNWMAPPTSRPSRSPEGDGASPPPTAANSHIPSPPSSPPPEVIGRCPGDVGGGLPLPASQKAGLGHPLPWRRCSSGGHGLSQPGYVEDGGTPATGLHGYGRRPLAQPWSRVPDARWAWLGPYALERAGNCGYGAAWRWRR
jgi:hypothetical protein